MFPSMQCNLLEKGTEAECPECGLASSLARWSCSRHEGEQDQQEVDCQEAEGKRTAYLLRLQIAYLRFFTVRQGRGGMGHGKANDIGHRDLSKARCVLRPDPVSAEYATRNRRCPKTLTVGIVEIGLFAEAGSRVGRKIAPRTNIVVVRSPLDRYPPSSQETRI